MFLNIIRILWISSLLIAVGFEGRAYSESSEDWFRKAGGATTQLLSGNIRGAADQVVPTYQTQLSKQTYLSGGLRGAGLRQDILPLNRLNSRYLHWDGTYNLGTDYDLHRAPHFAQDVRVGASNPYWNHTSTFTPQFPKGIFKKART